MHPWLLRCCAVAIVAIASIGSHAQPLQVDAFWPTGREVTAGAQVILVGSASFSAPPSAMSGGVGASVELPPGLSVVSVFGDRMECSLNATTATCFGAAHPFEMRRFFLIVTVPDNTPPGTVFLLPATFGASALGYGGASTRLVTSISTAPAPRADLRVTHTGPATIRPAAETAWTTVVTNDGTASAPEVRVRAHFSGPLTSVSVGNVPSFSCRTITISIGTSIVCDRGTIAAGESVTFSFTVRTSLAPAGTPFHTSVSASSPLIDPVANNDASADGVMGAGADVRITKTSVRRGTFEIVVTNDGPAPAFDVAMTELLPWRTTDFLALTQVSGPPFTCTPTASTPDEPTEIRCTAAILDPGASAAFLVLVDIPPGSVAPILNEAVVFATNDPAGPNNFASASMDPAVTIPTLSPQFLLLLAAALSAVAMTIVKRV